MKRLIKKAFNIDITSLLEQKWDGTKASLDKMREIAINVVEQCQTNPDTDCPEVTYMYIRATATPENQLYVWFSSYIGHLDVIGDLGYQLGDCVHLMINYKSDSIDIEYLRKDITPEQEKENVQKLLPQWTIN